MRRLNFLEDEPWDEVQEDRRVRWFGHPLETDMLGASLIELLPRTPGSPLHLHYGVEEMFFVLAGAPAVQTPEGEEQLSPGDVVYFPEGRDGLHGLFSAASGSSGRDWRRPGAHRSCADRRRGGHGPSRSRRRPRSWSPC